MSPERVDITAAVEGRTDEAVLRRLAGDCGVELAVVHGGHGKAYLDDQLVGFNNAARFAPWLVLRDLDQDAPCASELIKRLLPSPSEHMRFRIAVRATEAWLLADRDRAARFLQVPVSELPADVNSLPDPKSTLVSLAGRSRSMRVRQDMAPAARTTSRVGPAYLARVVEFASGPWRPSVARLGSSSLAGCMRALERWAAS